MKKFTSFDAVFSLTVFRLGPHWELCPGQSCGAYVQCFESPVDFIVEYGRN